MELRGNKNVGPHGDGRASPHDRALPFSVEHGAVVPAAGGRCKILDGRSGPESDSVFIERLWRSQKYGEVYLNRYESMSVAHVRIGAYLSIYNGPGHHRTAVSLQTAPVHCNRVTGRFILLDEFPTQPSRPPSPPCAANGEIPAPPRVIPGARSIRTVGPALAAGPRTPARLTPPARVTRAASATPARDWPPAGVSPCAPPPAPQASAAIQDLPRH